ncbi:MAG: hypothetical protein A3G76_00140 [Acidobacteria bacterium RIFCSPLOWO2_12_FULL_65_11]|nr:MAG: hypothetical protein A3H95_15485 [Acidobacteria bacterium RIFCSPLOWO2_02_FULL_64_15]OFW29318.1 MAG: hypothetical protein A3G76_00140 [Acidobacteria bacterium RIFCSPLOWO2_12_FULL_65_11]
MRVHLIGQSTGVGVSHDLSLMATALGECGCEVAVTALDPREPRGRGFSLKEMGTRLRGAWPDAAGQDVARSYDLTIMLEHLWPRFFGQARRNVVVPNPEWFDRRDVRALANVDRVWAKTGNTVRIFERYGSRVSRIGFDSQDHYDPAVAREPIFFHLAGNSPMKGTARLVQLWRQHLEWPTLIVIEHLADGSASPPSSENVQVIPSYVDDADLKQLQNRCLFHVCTSEAEGWGHYLVEAMSVGAVTITVDAPPMNELVMGERGVLVAYDRILRQKLAERYLFDEQALTIAVEQALAMTPDEMAARGTAARQWFLQNKAGFAGRISRALAEVGV